MNQLTRTGDLVVYLLCVLTIVGSAACGVIQPFESLPPDAPTGSGSGSDPGQPPSVDAAPETCFGTGFMRTCLMQPPAAGTLELNGPINTSSDPRCAALASGGPYCVVAREKIEISSQLRATGSKPLVLIASDSITVNALIDVGSHRTGSASSAGAGEATASVCSSVAGPTTLAFGTTSGTTSGSLTVAGGGAGGSFAGRGGGGGGFQASDPGTTLKSIGGIAGVPPSSVQILRGGCLGQVGAGSTAGTGGHGGGAIFLIAGNTIAINSTIAAGGEGGGGASGGGKTGGGGGGGGSGGMIGIYAPTIEMGPSSAILAGGGGGGEGGSSDQSTGTGAPGQDAPLPNAANQVTAAAGGTGGIPGPDSDGGAGGAGAGIGFNGQATNNGTAGLLGDGLANISSGANVLGGGGGGGGGAGLVLAPPMTVFHTLFPPFTNFN